MSEERQRLKVNWAQATGSALAAVSSAVLLSTVGVAGTLIGAAVGSVVVTVGGAIYAHSLETSKQRVAAASAAARERALRARARKQSVSASAGPERTQQLDLADHDLAQAEADAERAETEQPQRERWREAIRDLSWKRIGLAAGAVFVVAMLVVHAFELVTGRAVSTFTGGSGEGTRTSIPGIGGGEQSQHNDEPAPNAPAPNAPAPAPGEQPAEQPGQETDQQPGQESGDGADPDTPSQDEPAPEDATPTDEEPTDEPTDEEPTEPPTTPAPTPTSSPSPSSSP